MNFVRYEDMILLYMKSLGYIIVLHRHETKERYQTYVRRLKAP